MEGKAGQREVMDVAMEAGHILLESGAELPRVEETVRRICHYYGVESEQLYILSNGIFLTAGSERDKQFARVRHIPVKGAQLQRVAAVNQLSREIEEGKYELWQVKKQLEEIRVMPGKGKLEAVLLSGIGSGCFCLMFNGSIADGAVAFLIGVVLYIYLLWVRGLHVSKIMENIGGGIVITVTGILMLQLPLELNLSHMMSGAIMPLVPGLAFTNGIRDIADGDYLSGTVRMIDAILVFLSIAAGVGLIIGFYHRLTGGAIL